MTNRHRTIGAKPQADDAAYRSLRDNRVTPLTAESRTRSIC